MTLCSLDTVLDTTRNTEREMMTFNRDFKYSIDKRLAKCVEHFGWATGHDSDFYI